MTVTHHTDQDAVAMLPIDFSKRLVEWQMNQGRHGLPWQTNRTPYRVWLSEIMLQQTQVVTVRDYFDRFLQRFPDVQALANASQDEVLALWSGLGYYSRARNLHACAKEVCARFDGEFPPTAAQLQTLPGIGPSTAAAISSFCHGERVAIFDGNVKRVAARLSGYNRDLASTANERALHRLVQNSIPGEPSAMAAFTQGLMDLGATVCTPRKTGCERCPFQTNCVARQEGRVFELPVNSRKLARKTIHSVWLWLSHGNRCWLTQRPGQGIWAGLWSFPVIEETHVRELLARKEWSHRVTQLSTIKHVLTHRDWYLTPLQIHLDEEEAKALSDDPELTPGRWTSPADRDSLGLPSPVSKLLAASTEEQNT